MIKVSRLVLDLLTELIIVDTQTFGIFLVLRELLHGCRSVVLCDDVEAVVLHRTRTLSHGGSPSHRNSVRMSECETLNELETKQRSPASARGNSSRPAYLVSMWLPSLQRAFCRFVPCARIFAWPTENHAGVKKDGDIPKATTRPLLCAATLSISVGLLGPGATKQHQHWAQRSPLFSLDCQALVVCRPVLSMTPLSRIGEIENR